MKVIKTGYLVKSNNQYFSPANGDFYKTKTGAQKHAIIFRTHTQKHKDAVVVEVNLVEVNDA